MKSRAWQFGLGSLVVLFGAFLVVALNPSAAQAQPACTPASCRWVGPNEIQLGPDTYERAENEAWEFVQVGLLDELPAEATPTNIDDCSVLAGRSRLVGFNADRTQAVLRSYNGQPNAQRPAPESCAYDEADIELADPQNSDVPDAGGEGGGENDAPQCTTGNGLAGVLALAICPAVQFATSVITTVFNEVIIPFLVISPLTTNVTDQDGNSAPSPIYAIWQQVRNLTNIGFIIAFLFIVFSQSTSMGLSNYGVKKLLGRLVLAVIGANLSFFLIAFTIDAFNLLGSGISQLANLVPNQVTEEPEAGTATEVGSWVLRIGIGVAALGNLPIVGAAIMVVAPFILIGLGLAILVAIIILLRNAVIIAMSMFAPVPFVLWLLPGTEGFAKKYRSLLLRLLLMYPYIIAGATAGRIFSNVLDAGTVDLTPASIIAQHLFGQQIPTEGLEAILAVGLSLVIQPAAIFAGCYLGLMNTGGPLASVAKRGFGYSRQGRKSLTGKIQKSALAQVLNERRDANKRAIKEGTYTSRNPLSIGKYIALGRRRFINNNEKLNKMSGGALGYARDLRAQESAKKSEELKRRFSQAGPDATKAFLDYQEVLMDPKSTFDQRRDARARLSQELSRPDIGAESRQIIQSLVAEGHSGTALGALAAARSYAPSGFMETAQFEKVVNSVFGEGKQNLAAKQQFVETVKREATDAGQIQFSQYHADATGKLHQFKLSDEEFKNLTPDQQKSYGIKYKQNPDGTYERQNGELIPDLNTDGSFKMLRNDVKTAAATLTNYGDWTSIKKHALKEGIDKDSGEVKGGIARGIEELGKDPTSRYEVLRRAANPKMSQDQLDAIAKGLGYTDAKHSGFRVELQRVRDEIAGSRLSMEVAYKPGEITPNEVVFKDIPTAELATMPEPAIQRMISKDYGNLSDGDLDKLIQARVPTGPLSAQDQAGLAGKLREVQGSRSRLVEERIQQEEALEMNAAHDAAVKAAQDQAAAEQRQRDDERFEPRL